MIVLERNWSTESICNNCACLLLLEKEDLYLDSPDNTYTHYVCCECGCENDIDNIPKVIITFLQNKKNKKCPKCGSDVVVKTSNRTNHAFIGCSTFPKCRWSENTNKKTFSNAIDNWDISHEDDPWDADEQDSLEDLVEW